jgi:hypothetical protein
MSNIHFLRSGDAKFCLAHLGEEIGEVTTEIGALLFTLGEVQKAIGKAQRFGLDSINPALDPDEQETNAEAIQRIWKDVEIALRKSQFELTDVIAAYRRLLPHLVGN